MIKFKLPDLQFSIENSDGSFRNYKNNISKINHVLSQKAQKVGMTGEAFNTAYKEVHHKHIIEKQSLAEVIDKPVKIRALSKLLATENVFITRHDLYSILRIRPRLSLIFLSSLSSFYFRNYDQLKSIKVDDLGKFLFKAYKDRGKSISSDDGKLFSKECIGWLLNNSLKQGSLEEVINNENLSLYKNTRFYELLQFSYYLKQLENLKENEDSPLLDEVTKKKVYSAKFRNNRQLGHYILMTLIDKVTGDISDRWKNVVLSIAGDPRVPHDATNYRIWWQALGEERIQKVRGWLSKVDIELFLKVFDEYAKYKHDDAMKRMYPARKTFLLGLLEQKKVKDTRLYLSPKIQDFLRYKIDKKDIPTNTTLKGADMAIIYMDIGGDIAIVEGTHSFKCHLYKGLLENAVVYDYRRWEVNKSTLMDMHCNRLKTVTHNPPVYWQHKVIKQLKDWHYSVRPQDVLSVADYSKYKDKYGYHDFY